MATVNDLNATFFDQMGKRISPTRHTGNSLRVCMLTTRFYPDHGGGALQALRLCRRLAERKVNSFVITGHKNDRVIQDIIQGIPVTRLPLPHGRGRAVLPFYARIFKPLFARRHDYDLIHAHAVHHHAYAGFLAGRLMGKPAIAKVSGLSADTPACVRNRRQGSLQFRLLTLATSLVVTTQELYERTVNEGFPAPRMVIIPNGTDIHLFHPVNDAERARLRRDLALPDRTLIAVFVGAMRPVKGIDVLARAWLRLAESVPSLNICLVGSYREWEHQGVNQEYMAETRRVFALKDDSDSRIHFVGRVSNVKDYLQAADFFVLPSRSEGMPNSLLEAMACGLPFVATRLGCIEEMSPPEQRPYLVPVDDPRALAEAIIALASGTDIRRELGTASRRTVEERFSLDAVADRYVDLYRNLLEGRR